MRSKQAKQSVAATNAGGDSCPCGSGASFARCCQPILVGAQPAASAESLMRSRYTAFVRKDRLHLLRSWHPDTRPKELVFEPKQQWLGLKVIGVSGGTATDDVGEVEFVARYKIDGRGTRLSERSRFVRHDGRWVYDDAIERSLRP